MYLFIFCSPLKPVTAAVTRETSCVLREKLYPSLETLTESFVKNAVAVSETYTVRVHCSESLIIIIYYNPNTSYVISYEIRIRRQRRRRRGGASHLCETIE